MLKKILIIVISILLVSCSSKTDYKTEVNNKLKDLVQSSDLYNLDGNKVHLSDYKGKKVYIKFWASWCSICLSGLNNINELSKQDVDFEVLTIVAPSFRNEKDMDDFSKWFKSLEYKDIKVLMDNNGELVKNIGVVGYPTSLFLNSNQEIEKIQIGHIDKEDIIEYMKDIK